MRSASDLYELLSKLDVGHERRLDAFNVLKVFEEPQEFKAKLVR